MTDYVVTDLDYQGKNIRAAALFKDQVLTELRTEDTKDASLTGCILRGCVTRVSKNIGGAYVDVGYKTPVFLPLKGREDIRASTLLTVQIRKEAAGIKEPVASLELELAGRYMVTSTKHGKRSFSSLLSDGQKEKLRAIIPDAMCGTFHITMRTNAPDASPEELLREYSEQHSGLERILKEAETARKGRLLWSPPAFYEEMLRDLRGIPDRILSDVPACVSALKVGTGYLRDRQPLYQGASGGLSLAERYNLKRNLDLLMRKKVWLPCGGFLVIERTEAFYAIDVNSGHCKSGGSPEETRLLINREAVCEAARQIRLRDLSGMILIDLINMEEASHKEGLLAYMRQELAGDTARPEAVDLTPLGIMEIIRPKRRKPLAEVLES